MIDRALGPIPDTMNIKMFQYRNLGIIIPNIGKLRNVSSDKKPSNKSSNPSTTNSSTYYKNYYK